MKNEKFDNQPQRLPFALGLVKLTPNARKRLDLQELAHKFGCHAWGHWGAVEDQVRFVNQRGLRERTQVLSKYHTTNDHPFWIMTDLSQRQTVVLVEEDILS